MNRKVQGTCAPFALRERGSMVLEAAILTPLVLLLIGVIITGGRLALAQQSIEAAAAAAARSASIARTASQAQSQGLAAAEATMANHDIDCAPATIGLELSGLTAPVGTSATVHATVTCTVALADLAIPWAPSSITLTGTMSSPVDTYRERRG